VNYTALTRAGISSVHVPDDYFCGTPSRIDEFQNLFSSSSPLLQRNNVDLNPKKTSTECTLFSPPPLILPDNPLAIFRFFPLPPLSVPPALSMQLIPWISFTPTKQHGTPILRLPICAPTRLCPHCVQPFCLFFLFLPTPLGLSLSTTLRSSLISFSPPRRSDKTPFNCLFHCQHPPIFPALIWRMCSSL